MEWQIVHEPAGPNWPDPEHAEKFEVFDIGNQVSLGRFDTEHEAKNCLLKHGVDADQPRPSQ